MARATWTMPSGDHAWLPSASLVGGNAEKDHGGHPEVATAGRASFTSDSRVLRYPGQGGHGLRGASMPSRTNSGATRSFTVSLVSASISRSTAERRRRRMRVSGKPMAPRYPSW
jgi:hypothetical protein